MRRENVRPGVRHGQFAHGALCLEFDPLRTRSMNLWPCRASFAEKRTDTVPDMDALALRLRRPPDTFFKNAIAGWDGTAPPPVELEGDSWPLSPSNSAGDGCVSQAEDTVRRDRVPTTKPPGSTTPGVGDELGGFRLLRELGKGAEGTVYLAAQTELADRLVVLKVGPLQGGEHRALARLQHTHIVPILSSRDLPDRGLRVLCLPYMGGITLERLLNELANLAPCDRSGTDLLKILDGCAIPTGVELPTEGPAREFLAVESYERSIAWIGLCLAEALHHAHLRNLVHWDVKPANILLAADGMPLLLDFHLAQPPLIPGGERPERIGGTPPYIAPEQFAALLALTGGLPAPLVDGRADIYALAMVLHVALANERPVGEGEVVVRMRRANPRVSPGLAAILARALANEPHRRYPYAAAFAEDLRRHLDDQPLVGVANRSLVERWRKWHRQHPNVLAHAGAVATALLGFAAAGLIAWFAAERRLSDAMSDLQQGQLHLAAGDHRQAAQSFDHGLILLGSGTSFDRLRPRARDVRDQIIAAQDRNRRADLAGGIHSLADRVRLLYAAGPAPAGKARKIEERLAQIWRLRKHIDTRLPDEETRASLRADLLDLAILWADLRVELADPAARPAAHEEALKTLAQAEADWGPSPVLSQERRFHSEAIGRRQDTAQPEAEIAPRTAWECYAIGRGLLRRGALESAARALDRAVAMQPQSLWAQFYRGRCALLRNRYAEALDAFGACVALAPEAVCYHNRSLAYAGLGVTERARLDLERARELDPDSVAALPRSHLPRRSAR
jgi:serine/threonine protein kinase